MAELILDAIAAASSTALLAIVALNMVRDVRLRRRIGRDNAEAPPPSPLPRRIRRAARRRR